MFAHTRYLFHLIFLKLLALAVQAITFRYNDIKMDVMRIELAQSHEKLMVRVI